MIYKTVFENLRTTKVPIIDQDHKMIMTLLAGDTRFVETDNENNIFARYKTVRYLPGGKVEVEPNPEWKCSLDGWTIDIENVSASDPEKLNVGTDDWVLVPLGFTRTVRVPIFSPLIRFEKIILRSEKRKMRDRRNPAYFLECDVTVQEKIMRPQKDLDKVDQELKNRPGLQKQGRGPMRINEELKRQQNGKFSP